MNTRSEFKQTVLQMCNLHLQSMVVMIQNWKLTIRKEEIICFLHNTVKHSLLQFLDSSFRIKHVLKLIVIFPYWVDYFG